MKISAIRYATYAILAAIGVLMWRSRVSLIPVNLTGGPDFPEIRAEDMRNPTLPRLDQKERFPAIYRAASVDVASAISRAGLKPSEYLVELKVEEAGRVLNFSLWHESIVGSNYSSDVMGDPSGKCRTVLYDSVKGVVTEIYGWR